MTDTTAKDQTSATSLQPQAVIYARVSDPKQVKEGHGLSSQETRCREYARHKGLEVVEVFHEQGVSGALMERPSMQAMLSFLRKQKNDNPVVIIDDISRLARDIETHIRLRSAIADAGGKLESPSIEFGEDSDSILVENLLASVSQHQRQKNGEQVKNRMRARVLNGYYCLAAPYGYRYERVSGHGNMLVRDEPVASIVTEALEAFASGLLESQGEMKRFLESQPVFPKDRNGYVHFQRVNDLLTRPLYAGYLDVPNWGISMHPGKHAPLISLATWQKIQDRLKGKAKAPARKDINADFPLRGFVLCADCDGPLTACWAKGRSAHYPYYHCPKKGCASYGRTIRRDVLEGEFEALLKSLHPSASLFQMARTMFEDAWTMRLDGARVQKADLKREEVATQRKIDNLLDRVVEADNASVVTAYEKRIGELEARKAELAEKAAHWGQPVKSFDESFRTAMSFLLNPWKLWLSDHLASKRAVLKLTFADRLSYVRGEGFRTAKTTLPFKALAAIRTPNGELVDTLGGCSNQLFEVLEEWNV